MHANTSLEAGGRIIGHEQDTTRWNTSYTHLRSTIAQVHFLAADHHVVTRGATRGNSWIQPTSLPMISSDKKPVLLMKDPSTIVW